MSCKSSQYTNFNIDQLAPILSDMCLAKEVVSGMIVTMNDYSNNVYEIIGEMKEFGAVTEEMKAKVDKNVVSTMNELYSNTTRSVSFRNLGSKREKLFERLKRGINYKYKLCNGIVVENHDLLRFDYVCVDPVHRTIEIGCSIFQLSDSSDSLVCLPTCQLSDVDPNSNCGYSYETGCTRNFSMNCSTVDSCDLLSSTNDCSGNFSLNCSTGDDTCVASSCNFESNSCDNTDNDCNPCDNYEDDDLKCHGDKNLKFFLNKLQIEISKAQTIEAYLDILLACIKYAITIIITDITHFDLFDKSCLKSICNCLDDCPEDCVDLSCFRDKCCVELEKCCEKCEKKERPCVNTGCDKCTKPEKCDKYRNYDDHKEKKPSSCCDSCQNKNRYY